MSLSNRILYAAMRVLNCIVSVAISFLFLFPGLLLPGLLNPLIGELGKRWLLCYHRWFLWVAREVDVDWTLLEEDECGEVEGSKPTDQVVKRFGMGG